MSRTIFRIWNPALICFIVTAVVAIVFYMGLPIFGVIVSIEENNWQDAFGIFHIVAIVLAFLISGFSVGRGRIGLVINVFSCVVMVAATASYLTLMAGLAFGQAMQH